MSITREDVARVARLAELAVADDELPALVDLGHVHDDAGAGSFVAGPSAAPLRDDHVRPAVLAHPVVDMAPEFVDGFFAVPLRGGLEDTP